MTNENVRAHFERVYKSALMAGEPPDRAREIAAHGTFNALRYVTMAEAQAWSSAFDAANPGIADAAKRRVLPALGAADRAVFREAVAKAAPDAPAAAQAPTDARSCFERGYRAARAAGKDMGDAMKVAIAACAELGFDVAGDAQSWAAAIDTSDPHGAVAAQEAKARSDASSTVVKSLDAAFTSGRITSDQYLGALDAVKADLARQVHSSEHEREAVAKAMKEPLFPNADRNVRKQLATLDAALDVAQRIAIKRLRDDTSIPAAQRIDRIAEAYRLPGEHIAVARARVYQAAPDLYLALRSGR